MKTNFTHYRTLIVQGFRSAGIEWIYSRFCQHIVENLPYALFVDGELVGAYSRARDAVRAWRRQFGYPGLGDEILPSACWVENLQDGSKYATLTSFGIVRLAAVNLLER